MLIPEIPLDRQCQIIEYNKIGIYGIHKASGVLSHPNAKTKGKTIQNDLIEDNEITNDNNVQHSEEKTGWWS